MTPAKILVVDDERQIRRVLHATLTSQDYIVSEAQSGEEALEKMYSFHPDLVLLDVNMPGVGGLKACREIRQSFDTPILIVTVRGSEADKVRAFDAGADGYVVKPFSAPELLARIRAALRRTPAAEVVPTFVAPGLEINFELHKAIVRGQPVHLTPKEFALLQFLVSNLGKPLSHQTLLQGVWGAEYSNEKEYLRVFINQLRKKIEPDPHHPRYIHTDPWIGYRFEASPEVPKVRKS